MTTTAPISEGALIQTNNTKTAPVSAEEKRHRSMKLVRNYALVSGGTNLIPLPLFDQIAIGSMIGKMLFDISQVYDIKLSNVVTKGAVAAILGGAHAEWITHLTLINNTNPTITRPLVGSLVTYTIGKIFVDKFSSGEWGSAEDVQNYGESAETTTSAVKS